MKTKQKNNTQRSAAPWLGAILGLAGLLFGAALNPASAASRIKDIADFQGIRDNLLIGYGLVVGLNGTGDSLRNAPFTKQSLEAMLERLGVNTRDASLNTKNVAAVMVTASLRPLLKVAVVGSTWIHLPYLSPTLHRRFCRISTSRPATHDEPAPNVYFYPPDNPSMMLRLTSTKGCKSASRFKALRECLSTQIAREITPARTDSGRPLLSEAQSACNISHKRRFQCTARTTSA